MEIYAIVVCRGCETTSFKYIFRDYEQAFQVDEDEWHIPGDEKSYPRYNNPEFSIDGEEVVPELVSSIYGETISAVHEEAYMLASLGLRGTIEAICNDQNVLGKNLEQRIKGLATKGFISKKDSERLHAIRFLGNDAAHEIKKPNKNQIIVAIKIIKHLIASIYTLEAETDGKLDTLITEYEDYKKLIDKAIIKKCSKGEVININSVIGGSLRRLGENKAEWEAKLIADINSGDYKNLSLAETAKIEGAKGEIQLFRVETEIKNIGFLGLPFKP